MSTLDLLRRRGRFVRRRGATLAHITNVHHHYNRALAKKLLYASNRQKENTYRSDLAFKTHGSVLGSTPAP